MDRNIGPRSKNFNVRLDDNLNRSIIYTTYITGKPLHFSVLFSQKSSGIQFTYDSSCGLIQSKTVSVRMYRNLDNCQFSKIFLETNSFTNSKYDVRCSLVGTNRKFDKNIIHFLGEKLFFRTQTKSEKSNSNELTNNSLSVNGWKFADSDDVFTYYFVQRSFYNVVTQINVVRSCSIQFSTLKGMDVLTKYYDAFKVNIEKVDPNKLPDFLKDIKVKYDSDSNIVDKKLYAEDEE